MSQGGPAYVVTTSMLLISTLKNLMKHLFVIILLILYDIPANPGKKFIEALEKFIVENDQKIEFLDTSASIDFQKIYDAKHFPGFLGQVKKISIMHHIETINNYLINNLNN